MFGVSAAPGHRALQVTLCAIPSSATTRVSPTSACFVAQ